jgi:hypothetical protein
MTELIKIASMRGNLSSELGYMDIRVDRASVLGNPFELAKKEDRNRVSDAYEEWLYDQINDPQNFCLGLQRYELKIASKFKCPTSNQVRKELSRLLTLIKQGNKLRLICWCKEPDKEVRCHADSIKKVLLSFCKVLYKQGHSEYAWTQQ